MIALSFLGLGPKTGYQETTYVWEDATSETNFFPHAVSELFDPNRLLVVMTQQVREKYYDQLDQCCSFEALDVPTGENEAELWKMFEVIADAVPEGASLLVDVTHGFRTQPMLVLAAGLYLRAARNVRIERIVYGAWHARNEETNRTPVFDLTPFLNLVDWSAATRMLFRYGNAAPLRDLLQEIHGQTHRTLSGYQAEGLYHVGNALGGFTDALAVIRPQEVMEQAHQLPQQIKRAEQDLEHLPQTQPFSLLLEKIRDRVRPLAEADLFSPAGFRAQAAMIEFYLDTEQYPQAITLAREAIVSKVCAKKKLNPMKKAKRRQAEDRLNEIAMAHREGTQAPGKEWPDLDLWNQVSDLRNDINHAGMREDAFASGTAVDGIEKYCQRTMTWLAS